MKKQTLLFYAFLTLIAASCSKKNLGYFHNQETPYMAMGKPGTATAPAPEVADEQVTASLDAAPAPQIYKPSYKARQEKVIAKPANTVEVGAPAPMVQHDKQELKTIKKEVRKEVKKQLKQQQTNRGVLGTVILVILAFVLPPLAVALVDGITGPFWLDLLLTILFWIPGVIYALWRIFKD